MLANAGNILEILHVVTYPENPSIQAEALALSVHHVTVLHLRLGSHEGGLVQVGVKLLGLVLDLGAGIEALQTVLLQGVHEDVLGHLQTSDEVVQGSVLVSPGSTDLLRGHGQQRAVKVVNALQKVLGEALDGEVTGAVHVALGALLQVTEVGNRAEVFVLERKILAMGFCNNG